MNQPKIVDRENHELGLYISSLISHCYVLAGYQQYNERDISLLAGKLVADLKTSYSYMTLGEIEFCFECGVKGVYGEYHGINMRTFCKWLQNYKTSELRYKTLVNKMKEEGQKALPQVSNEYKHEHEMAFLRNVFRQYRAGYPLERLYPVYVYQRLQSLGYINHTAEEKQAAMKMFENYKPRNMLYMSEETREYIIKSEAMTWLLQKDFDEWITKKQAA